MKPFESGYVALYMSTNTGVRLIVEVDVSLQQVPSLGRRAPRPSPCVMFLIRGYVASRFLHACRPHNWSLDPHHSSSVFSCHPRPWTRATLSNTPLNSFVVGAPFSLASLLRLPYQDGTDMWPSPLQRPVPSKLQDKTMTLIHGTMSASKHFFGGSNFGKSKSSILVAGAAAKKRTRSERFNEQVLATAWGCQEDLGMSPEHKYAMLICAIAPDPDGTTKKTKKAVENYVLVLGRDSGNWGKSTATLAHSWTPVVVKHIVDICGNDDTDESGGRELVNDTEAVGIISAELRSELGAVGCCMLLKSDGEPPAIAVMCSGILNADNSSELQEHIIEFAAELTQVNDGRHPTHVTTQGRVIATATMFFDSNVVRKTFRGAGLHASREENTGFAATNTTGLQAFGIIVGIKPPVVDDPFEERTTAQFASLNDMARQLDKRSQTAASFLNFQKLHLMMDVEAARTTARDDASSKDAATTLLITGCAAIKSRLGLLSCSVFVTEEGSKEPERRPATNTSRRKTEAVLTPKIESAGSENKSRSMLSPRVVSRKSALIFKASSETKLRIGSQISESGHARLIDSTRAISNGQGGDRSSSSSSSSSSDEFVSAAASAAAAAVRIVSFAGDVWNVMKSLKPEHQTDRCRVLALPQSVVGVVDNEGIRRCNSIADDLAGKLLAQEVVFSTTSEAKEGKEGSTEDQTKAAGAEEGPHLTAVSLVHSGVQMGAFVIESETCLDPFASLLYLAAASQLCTAIHQATMDTELLVREREIEIIHSVERVRRTPNKSVQWIVDGVGKEVARGLEVDQCFITVIEKGEPTIMSATTPLLLKNGDLRKIVARDTLERISTADDEGRMYEMVEDGGHPYSNYEWHYEKKGQDMDVAIMVRPLNGPTGATVGVLGLLLLRPRAEGEDGETAPPPVFKESQQTLLHSLLAPLRSVIHDAVQNGRMRDVLSRSVDPKVMETLLANNTLLDTQRRHITVLFCDLRGSTALAESVEPSVFVAFTNEYFSVSGTLPTMYYPTV